MHDLTQFNSTNLLPQRHKVVGALSLAVPALVDTGRRVLAELDCGTAKGLKRPDRIEATCKLALRRVVIEWIAATGYELVAMPSFVTNSWNPVAASVVGVDLSAKARPA